MNRNAGPGLTLGGAIRLLPVMGGRLMHGTVVELPGTDDARGGCAKVAALPRVGGWMDGVRVWVLSSTDDPGTMTVHEARLRVRPLMAEVELTQISLLADEPRRATLRAAARRPMLLLRPGKVSSGTTSLDLSSTGCRMAVPDDQELTTGQVVLVAVDLDAGESVWADGQVVWVDDDTRIAALRFTRLDPMDQERLDRGVLAALFPRPGRHSTRGDP